MKKLPLMFFLVLFLSVFFSILPSVTSADSSCKTVGISSRPDFFPENVGATPGSVTLNFEIENSNTYKTVSGCEAQLDFGTGFFASIKSTTTVINNTNFSLTLDDDTLEKRGSHSGRMFLKGCKVDSSKPYCTDISYRVGVGSTCQIDQRLETKMPPGQTINVNFLGVANREYQIRFIVDGSPTVFPTKVTPGSDGQGRFTSVVVPGVDGQTITLQLEVISGGTGGGDTAAGSCRQLIQITSKAPPPIDHPAGSIVGQPAAPDLCTPANNSDERKALEANGVKVCSSSAGEVCDKDPSNPGIKTAIGCIHTNPVALVRDIMYFVVAISGGLAFLMMIIGAFGMITSAGNPDSLAAAKDRFTKAIEGLLFILFSVLLLRIIGVDILGFGSFLGVPSP